MGTVNSAQSIATIQGEGNTRSERARFNANVYRKEW